MADRVLCTVTAGIADVRLHRPDTLDVALSTGLAGERASPAAIMGGPRRRETVAAGPGRREARFS